MAVIHCEFNGISVPRVIPMIPLTLILLYFLVYCYLYSILLTFSHSSLYIFLPLFLTYIFIFLWLLLGLVFFALLALLHPVAVLRPSSWCALCPYVFLRLCSNGLSVSTCFYCIFLYFIYPLLIYATFLPLYFIFYT